MSFKLLQVGFSLASGGHVSISDHAVKAIESLPRRPLNLITRLVAGRRDKKVSMGQLARKDNLFPVCSERAFSTFGADMAARLDETSTFLDGNNKGEPHTSSPMVGYVDIARWSEDEDYLQAIPLLLISKVRSKQLETVGSVHEASGPNSR